MSSETREWIGFDAELFALSRPDDPHFRLPRVYRELLERTGGPVLELLCGQGTRAIELARSGYAVTGVDGSEDMLAFARTKLAAQKPALAERLRFVCADARSLRLGAQFALVFCEDWGFGYMLTQQDQIRFLETLREHLRDDGRGLVMIFSPTFKLRRDGARQNRSHTRELTAGSRKVRSTATHRFDALQQIETVSYRYVIEEPDRPPRIVEYESRFRHTHRFELELLFRCAGLRVIESWSDFIPYKGLAEQPALDNVENDFVYLLARA